MAKLKHHPQFWLRDDAAAQFDRAEDEQGVFTVNSAGRTVAEQQALINRWHKGGPGNRPPALYRPAEPAEASNHVDNGGEAVDLRDWRRFAVVCERYGFKHTYPDGDPVHFDFVGLGAPAVAGVVSQVVLDRQNFLISRGWDLVPDGKFGPRTKQAIKEYQTFLRKYGYTGLIDGDWGNGTQQAHARFWNELHKPAPAPSKPAQFHTGTVADLGKIGDVRGLQKVAKLNGYKGGIDNVWGSGSRGGLQTFLNRNYGGSLAAWLRAKWGYKDRDNYWGPNMAAAAARANAANFRALK